MSTFTENYNLIKPAQEDYYDVQDFNENMDAIDAQMAEMEQEIAGVGEKVDDVGEKVDAVGTNVDAVGKKVDTVGTNVNTVVTKVNSISTKVDSVSTKVDSVGTNVTSVGAKVDSVGTNVTSVGTNVTSVSTKVDSVDGKLGTKSDTSNQTMFGLLNQLKTTLGGLSVVKSIQRVVYTLQFSTTSATVSINTVNPQKCLVISERLYDSSSQLINFDYTLNATNITITHASYSSNSIYRLNVGFWIVEFY